MNMGPFNAYIHRLLRWSEKYTKTDMVYLARGGFWLALGQGVSSLSALVLAVAFANLVTPEVYGTYKYILALAGMFAIFSLPGMATAIARASARGHEGSIHRATRERIQFSLIGTVLALIGASYYFLNDNLELSLALLIIALTLPFFDTFTNSLSYLVGKRRFNLQTKYHAITQIISVGTLVGTLFFTDNLHLILIAYFLPLIITRTLLYWHTARGIPHTLHAEEQEEALTYGKHLTIMSILGIIASQIDKILLWKFLGPAQLATYAFAIAIPEQLKGPLKSVGELALPKFAAQTIIEMKKNLKVLWYKIFLYALLLLLISLMYIAAAPLIFDILFPRYTDSVIYSQIFSLSLVTGAGSIALSALSAHKKIKAQYILSTAQPLVTISLFLILIPAYGIIGAIIAWVCGRFVTFFLSLVLLATVK